MDIDIDFYRREDGLKLFKHVPASRLENSELKPHQTGVYVQNVPTDILENRCTLDYKVAADRGYFKIDFLSATVYEGVRDEEHLTHLMNIEPDWEKFQDPSIVNKLFHLRGHHIVTKTMKPSNVQELAACISMIRPGKKHLFQRPWDEVFAEIWKPDGDGYQFKKSHAVAYALAIIVQLNLMFETAEPSE